MGGYILALDEGTTASTAMVISDNLKIISKASNEIPQIYPRAGWVEHDPEEIWKATVKSAKEAVDKACVSPYDCIAIGITNQRETTVLWDRENGKPRYNAIVWQCRRTTDICHKLKEKGLEPVFQEKTGLLIDPYFSGTKIKWLLDQMEDLRYDAEKGRVAFGTIDSYLLFRLTSGAVHATDPSNAARTLIYNIKHLGFDEELLSYLDIPMSILPDVRPSAHIFGTTKGIDFLPDGIPISGIAGDQQSALFGQACFSKGESKCTYGTGAFLLVNIGDRPIISKSGLLTTIAWQIGDKVTYALEGSCFIAGAAVQWLRDGLGIITKSSEVETLAGSVPDTQGVIFVPALTGIGAPYWIPHARGALFGLTRATTNAHIARAVLEGIALEIADLILAMEADLGSKIQILTVDGGASVNNLLMQMQADALGIPVVRPKDIDTTALGAAMLAGVGAKLWDLETLGRMKTTDRMFEPRMSQQERMKWIDAYHRGIQAIQTLL